MVAFKMEHRRREEHNVGMNANFYAPITVGVITKRAAAGDTK